MKKIIGIVLSLATIVMLSSFVIAHNVNNDKTNKPETISAKDVEWRYIGEVKAKRVDGGIFTLYQWRLYENGRKREQYAVTRLHAQVPTSNNVYGNPTYGKKGEYMSEYRLVGYPDGEDQMGYYFNS
ncbi:MAG: hypothetical protein J6X59_07225 [Bacteroidales bacterium]|nr:hypothetical protein [Bacteroidales bacterium]